MKHEVLLVLVVIALGLVAQCAHAQAVRVPGSLEAIDVNVERILETQSDIGFFTIRVDGAPDFVQINVLYGEPSIDFPIGTPHQKKLKRKLRKTAKAIGLKCTLDKDIVMEMLVCPLPRSTEDVSGYARAFLIQVFNVGEDTPLTFEGQGFELSGAM